MRHPIDHTATRSSQGFTIIEVLVATALFAIVVLVVLVPITGLFGLTKRSTTQVSATNLAQQWVEQVKGQWQDSPTYNRACISTAPPASVTITIRDEDALGRNSSTSTLAPFPYTAAEYSVVVNANCSSVAAQVNPAPLRLIKVQATINDGTTTVTSDLNVEVAR